jgi:acyl transferase domain-containing protein
MLWKTVRAFHSSPPLSIRLSTEPCTLAGIPVSRIAGTRTSVHTGTFAEDYKGFFIEDPQFAGRYAASSLSPNMLANRISWFYDLRGESVNMDTACSSTLVALHAACQGLRTKSADVVRQFAF